MGDSAGPDPKGPKAPSGQRKVRRRSPTLIGMATAKPTAPIAPPKRPTETKPSTASASPASSGTKQKAFPASGAGGKGARPKQGALPPRRGGLPPRKKGLPPPPRRKAPPRAEVARPATPQPSQDRVTAPVPDPDVALPTTDPDLAVVEPDSLSDLGPIAEVSDLSAASEAEVSSSSLSGWSAAAVPTPAPADDLATDTMEGDAPKPPLQGEVTQVTEEPEALHTQPAVEIPFEGELAMEPTMPAAVAPSSPRDESPPATAPEPPARTTSPDPYSGELPAVSTVIVNPAEMQQPAQVYTVDVHSGEVSIQPSGELVVPPRKSRMGLFLGVGLAAFCVVGLGAGLGYWLMSPDAPETVAPDPGGSATSAGDGEAGDPATAEGEGVEAVGDDDGPAGDDPAGDDPAGDDPAGDDPAGDDLAAADPVDDPNSGDDSAPDEPAGDDAAPAPSAGPASIEAIEAFELERLRVSARARRMPEADRRRLAGRIRARALRAYREESWDAAATAYREALAFNDWDVASIEGMARTRARQGNFPEAIAWAELAVQRNPRSPATHRVLGDVWRQAGHSDRARSAWRRGLRRHPDDRWLRQRIRELDAE